MFRLRLRQIRQRFALVLEERARLAREIHDTLAQGFVGISSQLDAVALMLKDHTNLAAQASGYGAPHGAPQPDRGAPLGDGPARLGAGRPGPGRRARKRPASGPPDRRFAFRWMSPATAGSFPRKWSSTCCASRRKP